MTETDQREADLRKKRLVQEMFDLADSVGSGRAVMEGVGELWFKTWQEALDFQAFAEEQNLALHLCNADAKPVSWSGKYYRLWPNLDY